MAVRFSVKLINDDKTVGSYRLEEEMFWELREKLKPYLSLPQKVKPIKCVETGDILRGHREVGNWLKSKNIEFTYSFYSAIKAVCNRKRESAYGYHWVHLEDVQEVEKLFKW